MQTLIDKIHKMQRDQEQLCAECRDKHGSHPVCRSRQGTIDHKAARADALLG